MASRPLPPRTNTPSSLRRSRSAPPSSSVRLARDEGPFGVERADVRPARESRVIKKLQPPQKGSQHWERQYGDALVCVRYREESRRGIRYTTVEIVVGVRHVDRDAHHYVLVPINAFDEAKRQRAIELGAKWKRRHKAWLMTLEAATRLGFADHIIDLDGTHI